MNILRYFIIIILLQAVLQDVPVSEAELPGFGSSDELGPDQLLVPADKLQLRRQGCSQCNEL